MTMASLENLSFKIPPLWNEDLSKEIAATDGVERQLLIISDRARSMLKEIDDFEVTPERIAWFSIFAKAYSNIDSAMIALENDSSYILEILQRIMMELELQLHRILEPISDLGKWQSLPIKVTIEKKAEEIAWNKVMERMCAYTAWGLFNDMQHHKQFLERFMDGVWDPRPAAELHNRIQNDPLSKMFHELLFTELNIQGESELRKGRQKQEKNLKDKIIRLGNWLDHPKLQHWLKKMQNAYRGEDRRRYNFFELVDVDSGDQTIRKRLRHLKFEYGYHSYDEGSMLIHNSSIEKFLNIHKQGLVPLYLNLPSEVSSDAAGVGNSCNRVFLILTIDLKPRVW